MGTYSIYNGIEETQVQLQAHLVDQHLESLDARDVRVSCCSVNNVDICQGFGRRVLCDGFGQFDGIEHIGKDGSWQLILYLYTVDCDAVGALLWGDAVLHLYPR